MEGQTVYFSQFGGAGEYMNSGSIANAAAQIMGRRKTIHFSDGNLSSAIEKDVSDESSSGGGGGKVKSPEDDPDSISSKFKWKSAWDLTERDKEKIKKVKRKKHRKRSMISQSILDLIHVNNGSTHVNNTDNNDRQQQLRSFCKSNHVATKEEDMSPALTNIVPKLPQGKKLLEVIIDIDIDHAFKSAFENDTFYEIITSKNYGELHNYSVSKWTQTETGTLARTMHYEFPKTIAFSRYTICVDQVQTKSSWSTPGIAYGVDSVNRSSGVMYSDYFYLEVHVRLEKEDEGKTKLTIVADIVWEKPCLLKSKIETETMSGTKKYYEIFERELYTEKALTENVSSKQQPDIIVEKRSKTGGFLKKQFASSGSGLKNAMRKSGGGTATKVAQIPQKLVESRLGIDQQPRQLSFNETSVLVAFILVILTLLIITFAMFKLAGSIAALSERFYALEDLLEAQQQRYFNNECE